MWHRKQRPAARSLWCRRETRSPSMPSSACWSSAFRTRSSTGGAQAGSRHLLGTPEACSTSTPDWYPARASERSPISDAGRRNAGRREHSQYVLLGSVCLLLFVGLTGAVMQHRTEVWDAGVMLSLAQQRRDWLTGAMKTLSVLGSGLVEFPLAILLVAALVMRRGQAEA